MTPEPARDREMWLKAQWTCLIGIKHNVSKKHSGLSKLIDDSENIK